MTDKVVIMARGVGSRMRAGGAGTELTPAQRAAASQGAKGMMPIRRPFLDYVLHVLADAGYRRVCLVIGPDHTQIREHYSSVPRRRLEIVFAVQEQPRGTADAIAAAESFVGDDFFLAINSDNYYPLEACRALRLLGEAGVASFEREALIREGNIGPERIAKFAVLSATDDGYLDRIIEKPGADVLAALKPPVGVSMNCWMLPPSIFKACRELPLSPRSEYELPDAVMLLQQSYGERFRVVPLRAPVLDLSTQSDIPAVAARLADLEVKL
jgi:glucose-1-phosphate thymidylyltransferase